MNKPLIKAMDDMIKLFEAAPNKSLSMKQLIIILGELGNNKEEVRAAFWCLMSDGELKLDENYKARLNN